MPAYKEVFSVKLIIRFSMFTVSVQ